MKKVSAIILSILMVILPAACSKPDSNSDSTNGANRTLTIGLMPSVDAIPLILADEKGYYKKQGVNVKYEIFKSANDRDAAFQAGSLDGIIADQVAVCLYQNAGFDVKIVSSTDCDFMLVAGKDSGVSTIGGAAGKTIAISEKTVIEYTLDKMLEKNGIDPKSVNKTSIPAIPARLEMLKNGKVDMALLPEPFATFAVKDGGILLGKASDFGLNPTVLAFTQKAIDQKKDALNSVFNAYNEAVTYADKTPVAEYESTVIKTVGYPEEMKGSIVLPRFKEIHFPPASEVKDTISWALNKGIIKKSLAPEDLMAR